MCIWRANLCGILQHNSVLVCIIFFTNVSDRTVLQSEYTTEPCDAYNSLNARDVLWSQPLELNDKAPTFFSSNLWFSDSPTDRIREVWGRAITEATKLVLFVLSTFVHSVGPETTFIQILWLQFFLSVLYALYAPLIKSSLFWTPCIMKSTNYESHHGEVFSMFCFFRVLGPNSETFSQIYEFVRTLSCARASCNLSATYQSDHKYKQPDIDWILNKANIWLGYQWKYFGEIAILCVVLWSTVCTVGNVQLVIKRIHVRGQVNTCRRP
jgi:hypothetical protein